MAFQNFMNILQALSIQSKRNISKFILVKNEKKLVLLIYEIG